MSTSSSVSIIECTEPGELHQHLDRQFEAQPCYISLGLRNGELSAAVDVTVEGGVPRSVYYQFERRYRIPPLTAEAANRTLFKLAPLADRMLADWEQEWTGVALIAVLGEDARLAEAEILSTLGLDPSFPESEGDHGFGPEDMVESWDVESATNGAEVDEFGIVASTTDADLREIERQILHELGQESPYGVLVSPGLYDYLSGLRDEIAKEDPLTDAEVRAARESLALTGDRMAQRLGVDPRTLRSWEQGRDPVPGWARPAIAGMQADTDRAAEIVSAGLDEEDVPVLVTYRSDEEYRAAVAADRLTGIPDASVWSASWYRQVCARAAAGTGARLVYLDGDGDDGGDP